MKHSKKIERIKKRIAGQVGDGDEVLTKIDPDKKFKVSSNVLSTGRTKKVTGKEPVSSLVSHKQMVGRNRNVLDKIWKRIKSRKITEDYEKLIPIKMMEEPIKEFSNYVNFVRFKAKTYGKDFFIRVKRNEDKFEIESEFGKVNNINKKNIIGEIIFSKDTKVVFEKDIKERPYLNDEIYIISAIVKR